VILPEHTRTGPQGEFDFGVVSGRLRVSASRGYGASSSQEVELQGRERFLELTMDPGVTVGGRVTLAGEPAAKVMVGWSCAPGSATVRLTNKAGDFLFEQVKEGAKCAVVARPAGEHYLWNRSGAMGGFASTQVLARAGDQDVELALERENQGSLKISFDGQSADYRGDFSLVPLGKIEETTPVREVKGFSPASTISVGGLRAGTYRLEADLDDGMDPAPVVVEINSGQESKVTLMVPDGMARGTASGRLIDSRSGQALGGITLWYSSGEHSAAALKTKPDGTFQFEYAAQRTGIHVSVEGYEPLSLEVAVGQGESAELGTIKLVRQGD
jgi:hypothetical protein